MKNKSILYSLTKSLLDTVSMYLFLDIPPTHFRSFSLIASLPLSFSFDACPTLSSYIPLSDHYYFYLYLLLHLTFTLLIAIILLLVLHISLSLSLSVSLTQPLTIVLFMFATLFLSFSHSCYDIVLFLF